MDLQRLTREPSYGLTIKTRLQLSLKGRLERFPDSSALWVGVEGSDLEGLCTLQGEIEQFAQDCRFPATDFPFTPHITVGRFRGQPIPHKVEEVTVPSDVMGHISATPFQDCPRAWGRHISSHNYRCAILS